MTKRQLIDTISGRMSQVPRRALEDIVNALFERMIDALMREERIEIRGFGSFSVKTRAPRQGRNPKTGQNVSVPQRRLPSFTVGKELRDRLNASSSSSLPPQVDGASDGAVGVEQPVTDLAPEAASEMSRPTL